jgi:hypothetical protein
VLLDSVGVKNLCVSGMCSLLWDFFTENYRGLDPVQDSGPDLIFLILAIIEGSFWYKSIGG